MVVCELLSVSSVVSTCCSNSTSVEIVVLPGAAGGSEVVEKACSVGSS